MIALKHLTALLLLALLGACGNQENTPKASSTPRLVVLGGELAETVVALGHEEHLVAVDTTSLWPPRLQQLPSVGYLRQLNTEGVLALSPTLILASHEAGPADVLEQWRALGIEVRQFKTGPDIWSAKHAIHAVGELLSEEAKATTLIDQIDKAQSQLQAIDSPPRALFLLSRAGNQALVAGTGTKAHTVISAAGGHNLGAAFKGYKPLSPEAIVKLAPDMILVPSHSLQSFGGREALLNDPAIRLTPAGKRDQVIVMESQVMLSLGPRLGEGLSELNRHFAQLASHNLQTASHKQ